MTHDKDSEEGFWKTKSNIFIGAQVLIVKWE